MDDQQKTNHEPSEQSQLSRMIAREFEVWWRGAGLYGPADDSAEAKAVKAMCCAAFYSGAILIQKQRIADTRPSNN